MDLFQLPGIMCISDLLLIKDSAGHLEYNVRAECFLAQLCDLSLTLPRRRDGTRYYGSKQQKRCPQQRLCAPFGAEPFFMVHNPAPFIITRKVIFLCCQSMKLWLKL